MPTKRASSSILRSIDICKVVPFEGKENVVVSEDDGDDDGALKRRKAVTAKEKATSRPRRAATKRRSEGKEKREDDDDDDDEEEEEEPILGIEKDEGVKEDMMSTRKRGTMRRSSKPPKNPKSLDALKARLEATKSKVSKNKEKENGGSVEATTTTGMNVGVATETNNGASAPSSFVRDGQRHDDELWRRQRRRDGYDEYRCEQRDDHGYYG